MLDKPIALNALLVLFINNGNRSTESHLGTKNLQIHGHNLHVGNQGHEGGPAQLIEKRQ